jgi:hypothetical protein
MLKVDRAELNRLEKSYQGIRDSILRFENAKLPACPHCGSEDTADVQVGVIGRTMNIAAATTKVRLLMNGPKPGKYACNNCNEFFDQEQSTNQGAGDDVKAKEQNPNVPGGFLSRPADKSLAAYKRWIRGMTGALGGDESDDMTEEKWQESWKKFWSD